jgi:hypothetical protein
MRRAVAILASALLIGCSSSGVRGIADKRSDFRKFMPMTSDPAHHRLKAVRPYFKRVNRAQILRAIESACQDARKRGASIFNPAAESGYYVNCNPQNRQLLNGYVSSNPSQAPRGR